MSKKTYIAKIYHRANPQSLYELDGARIPFSLPLDIPNNPQVVQGYINFSDLTNEIKNNPTIKYISNNQTVEFDTDKDLTGYRFIINQTRSCGKVVGSYQFEFRKI